MKIMKSVLSQLTFIAVIILLTATRQTAAQNALTLRTVGNGEKVKIAAGGKSKVVRLAGDFGGDFIAGGSLPYRYPTLLSLKKGASFYLVAKITSGAAISDKNAPCGGDSPITLLLIQASINLAIEKVQTEVFASCAFNGTGRDIKGNPQITKNKATIRFDEGAKKYVLKFDARAADKGLQLLKQ